MLGATRIGVVRGLNDASGEGNADALDQLAQLRLGRLKSSVFS
jgi:hypothetical protein